MSIRDKLAFPFREIRNLTVPDSEREKLPLNGIRGISVLMIIFFHSTFFAVFYLFKDNPEKLYEFMDAIPAILSPIFAFDKAVDIFFILSAYLLTSQLFYEVEKKQTINLKNFYIRRFFRIYPLFIIALLLYTLSYLDDWFPRILYNLVFIDNFFNETIIPVGWSLAIEVQFYVVLPFLILICYKIGRMTPWFILTLLAGAVAVRYFISAGNPDYYEIKFINFLVNPKAGFAYMHSMYYSTYGRFGLLIIGMFWAYIDSRPDYVAKLKKLSKTTGTLIFTFSIIMIGITLLFPSYNPESWYNQNFNPQFNLWALTLHRVVFGVFVTVAMIMIDLKRIPNRLWGMINGFLSHGALRVFSQLSFPMFLFHFPFVALAYPIVFGTIQFKTIENMSIWQAMMGFMLTTIFTLFFSIYMHKFIEQPFIKKGKALSSSSR